MDSIDELDMFEAERRLALYNEYRDAARVFSYYIETELRAYLANDVVVEPVSGAGGMYFKVTLTDVWIYEAERLNRFVPETVIYSVNDVHVQKLKGEE
jgi:predicted ATP-grasp superfamily ATP-dependent carboligase